MYGLRGRQLPSRQDGIEKFCTFLVLGDTEQSIRTQWVRDRLLFKNFQSYQAKDPQFQVFCENQNEKLLLQYFLELWKSDNNSCKEQQLARNHIAAYLELSRYRAVIDRFNRYQDLNFPQDTWDEYLHLSACITSDTDKIDRSFQRYNVSDDLETYFQQEIFSYIRDEFFKTTKQGKYSPWYSLKASGKQKLRDGLQTLGVKATEIPIYITIRDCLFEVYSRSGSHWVEPTTAQYQAAVNYYNTKHSQNIDVNKFKSIIKICLQALQVPNIILYPFPEDIDSSMKAQNSDLVDLLLAMEDEIENQIIVEKINMVLSEQLEKLEDRDKTILKLCASGKTQKQTSSEIGVDQPTVSRRKKLCERKLLNSLSKWVQENVNISLDLTAINHLSLYIDDWLKRKLT